MKIQYQNSELVIFESALFRTTTTLLFAADYVLLVDPNWLPIEIDFIDALIKKRAANKKKYLLFTHSDYDHIIGYGKFKDFETIASLNFVNNADSESILKQINDFDDENYIKRDYEICYPNIKTAIEHDAHTLKLGSDEYAFYQARGHNKDGLISFNKSKGVLIVGDYLSNIEFPYIYDSSKAYKKTLEKLETLINTETVNVLIPGHGDVCYDKSEMQQRINESFDYLQDLENSVKTGKGFDFEKLMSHYQFPVIMRKFHEANVALIKSEIAMNI
jgi:hydroxyacylglutathione hydrolase